MVSKKVVLIGITITIIGKLSIPFISVRKLKMAIGDIELYRPENNVENYRIKQLERVDMVHQACHKYKTRLDSFAFKRHRPPFFEAKSYNWSYCKIGKIGSTVWTQFFYILHHKNGKVKDVLQIPRQDIHVVETKNAEFGVKKSFLSTRMVLSARNPYTRLFSSYIDRMYVPSTTHSVRGANDQKCKSEITFSEFLKFVVENTRKGSYDYHWTPIFYFCKPCELSPSFVFKIETFKEDFTYVINNTRLEPYKHDVLSTALREESKWTGFALIDDVMDRITPINQHHTLDCLTWEQITNRIWEALKMQGFILDNTPFPSNMYNKPADFKNSSILRKALHDARAKSKPSKAEKSLQRLNALNRYYRSVDPGVIKDVQDVFRPDFDIFGYDLDPPPWK